MTILSNECAYDINNNITQITGYEWDLNENMGNDESRVNLQHTI